MFSISTRYLPPVLWAILIFILSAIPGDNYPSNCFDYAPLAHFIEFGVLAILILRASGIKDKNIYWTLIISVLYAVSDEIHQMFVAGRSAGIFDWLIDFLGILVGIKFWWWIKSRNREI